MGKVNGVFAKTLSMPVVVPNIESRVTSHVGRQGQWSGDQRKLIDDAVPGWLHYSLVINARLDGGHTDLQDWKKKEANRLLSLPEFCVLPDGVRVNSYDCQSRILTELRWMWLKRERR